MVFRTLLCIRIDEETELRIYEERHAQEVAELVDQNRAYLRQWLPWVDNSRTVEDSRALCDWKYSQLCYPEKAGVYPGRDLTRSRMAIRSLCRHGCLWFVGQRMAKVTLPSA
jgi:hypothetical protein